MRFKKYISQMRARLDLLKKYWDKELQRLVIRYVKIKTKSKKQKDFLSKLRSIKDSFKEAVLTEYLEKCKTQNALMFFDWRRRLQQQNLDKDQQLMFSIRINLLKQQERKLFKNTQDEVEQDLKKQTNQITKLDSGLRPTDQNMQGLRGSISTSKRFTRRPQQNPTLFVTEGENEIEDLIKNAPFSFVYVPTQEIMQKLIIKATQIKMLEQFQEAD